MAPMRDAKPKEAQAQKPATERVTMTIEETAAKLGISLCNAYTLANSGKLPTIRLGHRLLVPKHAFDKLIGLAS
jgi:excisionase family DNA binding protein